MFRCLILTMAFTIVSATAVVGQTTTTGASSPGAPVSSTVPPVLDTIEITDSLSIEDIVVGVDVVHTFQGDLTVDLTSPAGTTVLLTENQGGSANNILVSFASLGAPFNAADLAAGLGFTMQAFGPGTMVDFHDEDSLGSWSLFVLDDVGGDSGVFNNWTVTLTGGAAGGGFRRGDANDDGAFDVSDPVFTLAALFIPGSAASTCADAADTNDDGTVDVSDTVFMLAALFIPGSAPPPAPGPLDCSVDPTTDSLECTTYDSCP